MIWLTLLPFTLFNECGWTTVPLSLIIAFLLLGEAPSVHWGIAV